MKIFEEHTRELIKAAEQVGEFHGQVKVVADYLKEVFAQNNKVLIAGNGGSAAEAQHFSDEFLGRYRADRPAYPVTALTADSMAITCIGNDYGFEEIFSRQVEALGQKGDVFIGLTTSGTSKNILKAAEVAKQKGMTVVAMMGLSGEFEKLADYVIKSPSQKAAIVQEFHLHAIHLICELFEPNA